MKNLVFLGLIVFSAVIVAFADNEVKIVSRSEWGAKPAKHAAKKLDQAPAPFVIVGHVGDQVCSSLENCVNHLRNTRDMHVEQQGLDDIAFNFLVGGDGNVYEGRGWDVQGQHTPDYDAKSLGIAFVGNFEYKEPSAKQVAAAQRLLEFAVKEGKVTADYKLLGQQQVKVTKSPGSKLQNAIQTWEHWTSSP